MPDFASQTALHSCSHFSQGVTGSSQNRQECDSPGWWLERAGGDSSTAVQVGRTRALLCPQDTWKFVIYITSQDPLRQGAAECSSG